MTNNDKAKKHFEIYAQEKMKGNYLAKGLIIIVAILVCGLVFVGCKSDKMRDREKVKVGVSKSFLSIPVYIAQKQGFFSDEGLDVTVKEYSSGKVATKALFAGEIGISTVADMPVVFNSFKRNDFCIFATFTYSYPFVKIIARKDTGIKTGTNLKGRKVGVNIGTSSHFFMEVFLMHNRVSASDVEMINIKTVDLPLALKNNDVDAIAVWQPYSQKAKQLMEDNAIELPSSEIYRTTFSFATMKNFSKEHPEMLERFLRALDKAAAFTKNDSEKAQEIIAGSFNLDRSTVRAAWDDFVYGIFLDQSLLVGWDEIARWAITNSFVDKKKIPNYLNYICADALRAVKPESITIIGYKR